MGPPEVPSDPRADTGAAASPAAVPQERPAATQGSADGADPADAETFNPWSVVNVVFTHLAQQGLHPVLGEAGDPGAPARDLLLALGIEPAAEGNREVMRDVRAHLAEIRVAMFENE